MPSNYAVSVLFDPFLIAEISQFQDGIFGDLVPRYQEYKRIETEGGEDEDDAFTDGYEGSSESEEEIEAIDEQNMIEEDRDIYYLLPDRYRKYFHNVHEGALLRVSGGDLCLDWFDRDPSFPLHIAIVEGDLNVVKRWMDCHRELVTLQAIDCATRYGHVAIVKFLNTKDRKKWITR